MPEVRDACHQDAVRREQFARVGEHTIWAADVLEHVRRDDHVEPPRDRVADPLVEIGAHEGVDAVAHAVGFLDIDTRDVMAALAQLFGELPARAPEIEDAGRWTGRDPRDDLLVRRELAFFHLVIAGRERGVARAEPDLVHAVTNDIGDDVARVSHPVHVTDLVAVIRGDRHLDDALPRLDELDDDLSVEVEAVVVLFERDLGERGDAIGAVAAVPLRQVSAHHRVLEPREDAVPDELVERHAASAGIALLHHARPEHRVALAVDDRRHDVGQLLGGVLTVAVERGRRRRDRVRWPTGTRPSDCRRTRGCVPGG